MKVTRRSALTTFSVLPAMVAATAVGGQSGGRASSRRPRIGLQLYSVRSECARDLPGVLKAVAGMGYEGVEFAGYYGRSAQELRQMLDENRLQCCGTHIPLNTLQGENLGKTIEFNKVLGNRFLIVPWLPAQQRNSPEACEATARIFNEIAKQLEPHGMFVGYHSHADDVKPLPGGETPWDLLFQKMDRRVVMQLDIGNSLSVGVQAAPILARYPGRARTVHVKDYSATNDKALLGEGDVPWKEVIPLLQGKAGTEWYIIEQESYPYPPLVCAEKCLQNWKRLIR